MSTPAKERNVGRRLGRKGAGVSKTIGVSLRLMPRTHHGLDLLARKRHTTLTSVVEWAVIRAINDALEGLVEKSGDQVVNILDQTWDPEEADRFVKLARGYPALLRFEEDRMWKAIREDPKLWTERTGPRIAAIREQWPSLRRQYLMKGK
jgi:hypothetical protein